MKLEVHYQVSSPCTLIELLHAQTQLSKSVIKKALNYGGGWLQKGGQGRKQRCRRASRALKPKDQVSFYFDSQLYQQTPPQAQLLLHTPWWGIWYKPVNVITQGSPYGDAGCMEEQVKALSMQQHIHLVHRLDREASGLMLFAYSGSIATALSQQWHSTSTEKYYQTTIRGLINPAEATITTPLDGKDCSTSYRVVSLDGDNSNLEVKLNSGRFHQIRRHFAQAGRPLIGDPRYGENNKNDAGLQLVAHRLRFECPQTKQLVDYRLPEKFCLF